MEPTDLTIRILQEIRDEIRTQGDRTDKRFEQMDRRFEQMDKRFEQMDTRFEVLETTLRDLAEQMVMLARGVKSALEVRANVEKRLDDYEQRLADIEKRVPH